MRDMPYPETEEFFMEYIQCQNCGKIVQLVDDLETTGCSQPKCPYCKSLVILPPKSDAREPGQDPKEFV